MKKFKRNSGFTLAEVLITLAVIGVVAALTIPSVIKNYNNTQTLTQLKKTFSGLKRVHEQILFENGGNDPYFDLGTYDATNIGKYCDENWATKLKSVKKCSSATACGYKSDTPYVLAGTSNAPAGFAIGEYDCGYVLGDGTVFNLRYGDSNIVIDLNGLKGPNKLGRDVFLFSLTKINNRPTLIARAADVNCGSIMGLCDPNSNAQHNGLYCAARIMKCDGWEIKY